MKIILLNPPFFSRQRQQHLTPPLGLGYLAGVLRKAEHQVAIMDLALGGVSRIRGHQFLIGRSFAEAGDILVQERPDLVGISCAFSSRLSTTVRLANLVRECLPQALVVVGGLAVSIYPGVALERTGADWVIIGEGEQAFLNLVKALEGKGDIGEIRGIMGYFKGNLISNPGLDLPEDLDGIPFPARDLMPMEAYIEQKSAYWSRRRGRQTSIITSRGCPQKCTFCSVHHLSGKRWRGRSAENVLEELELLVHRYKVDSIAFLDDNFAFHRGRLKTICQEIIKRNLKINWCAPNGISIKTLDPETLRLMKGSGCELLNLAIESGDEFVLNSVIGKRQSLEQVREVAENCQRLGIKINGYFVIGMPGESENSIIRSLEFAQSLPLGDVGIFIATPFPGTELYQRCLKENLIDLKQLEEVFEEIADDAVLHIPLIETPLMSRERIKWWEGEFHRQFWKHRGRKNPLLIPRLIVSRMLRKVNII